jgi:transcriptional regulator with XRE-family HTH domain
MSDAAQDARRIETQHPSREASTAVALNVRRLRLSKGYTREELAQASGVELAVIEDIELEKSQLTIAVLWSVANALGVPVGTLLAWRGSEKDKENLRLEARRLSAERGEFICRLMLPPSRGSRRLGTEVRVLKLTARGRRRSVPRAPGCIDNLLVTSGALRLEIGKTRHELVAGGSVHFRSDVERTYENLSDQTVTMYVVTTYATQPD